MRSDFGANWAEVENTWCLSPLAVRPDIAWGALGTMERLWPEYLDQVCRRGAKGLAVMVPVVEIGLVLSDCEQLVGFVDVLVRAKKGSRHDLNLLFTASDLVRIGYAPRLEPPLDGKMLDAVIATEGREIFIEVISPEESDRSIDAGERMDLLTERLTKEVTGRIIELELDDPLTTDVDFAVAFAKAVAPSATIHVVPGVGHLRCWLIPSEPGMVELSGLPEGDAASDTSDRPKAQLLIGETPSQQSMVMVGRPSRDVRAVRLIEDEMRHFSRDTTNVLIIEASAIPIDEDWLSEARQVFTPNKNRRLGAVLTVRRGLIGPGRFADWRWIQNPHARMPVPDSFLQHFRRAPELGYGAA